MSTPRRIFDIYNPLRELRVAPSWGSGTPHPFRSRDGLNKCVDGEQKGREGMDSRSESGMTGIMAWEGRDYGLGMTVS